MAEVSFFLSFIYLLFSWTGWLSYWALPLTLGVLGPWKIRSLKQEEALEKVAFRHIPAWPIESEAASSFPLRPPPPVLRLPCIAGSHMTLSFPGGCPYSELPVDL